MGSTMEINRIDVKGINGQWMLNRLLVNSFS
jgi:hypothetical protein